jgi:hypothetical protein
MMTEIKHVVGITANPSGGRGDLGQCAEGNYFVEDGILTVRSADGVPLRDANNGERIMHHLAPGEGDEAIAKRLTLRLHREATICRASIGRFAIKKWFFDRQLGALDRSVTPSAPIYSLI